MSLFTFIIQKSGISPWRKLNSWQQALLALAYLRKGAGDHVRVPYKGKGKPASQKDASRANARLRSPR